MERERAARCASLAGPRRVEHCPLERVPAQSTSDCSLAEEVKQYGG